MLNDQADHPGSRRYGFSTRTRGKAESNPAGVVARFPHIVLYGLIGDPPTVQSLVTREKIYISLYIPFSLPQIPRCRPLPTGNKWGNVSSYKIMTAPRRLAAYPDWFLTLAGEFEPPTSIRRKVYILPSRKQAIALRTQLYGFLRVLDSAEPGSSFKQGAEYPNFLSVRLVIRENELHIVHANEFLPRPPERQS